MTDEALFELLEEARQACGKNAVALAAFLGARLPNEPPGLKVSLRRRVADLIAQFTGKRVELPAREEPSAYVGDRLARIIVDAEQKVGKDATAIWRYIESQPPGPDEPPATAIVLRAAIERLYGPITERRDDGGCSWCGCDEVLIGGVVAFWAFERKLWVCRSCADRGVDGLEAFLCQVCHTPIAVGEWGCITRVVAHGTSVQTTAFAAYFDVGLGQEITGLGDRHAAMRPEGTQIVRDTRGKVVAEASGRGRLEYRDLPSKGELSARQDRLHERRQKAERRG